MSSRRLNGPPKKEGFSPAAFWILLIFTILITIALIIMIVLYYRSQGTLIDPANCPEQVTGIVVTPDSRIATLASNCGNNANCTFTVGSIQAAVQVCTDLGSTKCAAFSMEQQTNSDDFTLTISESTDVVNELNVDSLRIIV